MHKRFTLMLVGSAAGLVLGACAAPRTAAPGAAGQIAAPVEQSLGPRLARALDDFESFFDATVSSAAAEIEAQAKSRAQRKAALLWKVSTTAQCEDAINQPDSAASLVDTWTLCVRMRLALDGEPAGPAFETLQPLAVAAAQRLEQRVQELAREFVPPDKFNEVATSVTRYAQDNPMDATFSSPATPRLSSKPDGQTVLGWLMTPLAPLQTFTKINRTADSISEMRPVAERFTEVVAELPAKSRWQLQLLLVTLEEMETIRSAIESLQTLSANSTRFATVAENLPERLRVETTRLIEEIDNRQGALQQTLDKADQVTATIERTVNASTRLAESLQATAGEVRLTIQSVAELKGPAATSAPANASLEPKPFDVAEYSQAADRITHTTVEMRGLLTDLRTLLESKELTGGLATVRTETQDSVRGAVAQVADLSDHVTWRAAQLLGLAFLLALVYRFATSRLRPRKPAA